MTSGANFGFRRTVPHLLGVAIGFVAMAFLTGLGLSRVFDAVPALHWCLTVFSVLYLGWLAFRIARATPGPSGNRDARPLTFLQAAAFQWVNPKGWAMALSAVTLFAPGNTVAAMATVALVFGAVNLPSIGSWCWLGTRLSSILTTSARLAWFNRTMAALLVLSLYPILA